MNKETARYILRFYSEYLFKEERLAIRHHHSTQKFDLAHDTRRTKVYLRRGWLTEDPAILSLLKDGIDNFEKVTAQRILSENRKNIVLNMCEKCGRLARTPNAKQCRHCGHDWH